MSNIDRPNNGLDIYCNSICINKHRLSGNDMDHIVGPIGERGHTGHNGHVGWTGPKGIDGHIGPTGPIGSIDMSKTDVVLRTSGAFIGNMSFRFVVSGDTVFMYIKPFIFDATASAVLMTKLPYQLRPLYKTKGLCQFVNDVITEVIPTTGMIDVDPNGTLSIYPKVKLLQPFIEGEHYELSFTVLSWITR